MKISDDDCVLLIIVHKGREREGGGVGVEGVWKNLRGSEGEG